MARRARADLARFVRDDVGRGDATSSLLPRRRVAAFIVARQDAVIAGVREASEVFRIRGCAARALARDGRRVRAGARVMRVSGSPAAVFSAERTALNVLSRMSGIATEARRLSALLAGTRARLYATRKTAPGLGRLDKDAVAAGGGMRHRGTLADMVLIKDNHIAAAARSGLGIADLVARARARRPRLRVEVEAETAREALAAARAGADIVMLDNFTPARARRAIAALRSAGLRRRVLVEASGGITARSIRAYAEAGADMISIGALTSSARGVDLSLEVA